MVLWGWVFQDLSQGLTPGVENVLADHLNMALFARPSFLNDRLCNGILSLKSLDLLKKNNRETKRFIVSVFVVELRWDGK